MLREELEKRSGSKCELCGDDNGLSIFTVARKEGDSINENIYVCSTCNEQLTGKKDLDPNHWRCLNDSIWSEVEAVKVVAWRVLNHLKDEGWPNDLLDMMYMEEETESWAKEGMVTDSDEDTVIHKDSNGVQLFAGDSVVLIKDLKVKGGGFTAKRGTHVRNIVLIHDNPEQIEGKIEGQRIVILTKYVKK